MSEWERGGNKKRIPGTRPGLRPILISAAVAAAAAIVIICAIAALLGRDRMAVEEPVYTVINGEKMEWPEGATLIRRKGETFLKSGRYEQDFQRYPLITEQDGKIILQKSCSLNRTSENMITRLDYFTVVSRDGEGVLVSRRDRQTRDVDGFIFDNEDTYIFLENAILSWGEERIPIEPLTIVQVSYMEYLQIFGPGITPRFEWLATDTVTAEFENGKRLNLATDRFYDKNSSCRLLFLPLEALPEMKTGETGNEEE
ncbi:MAG: hypothetical protein HFH87_09425 [Lachnospiraceae bacterium]|nr:hypothetical protein [Lachnospiraceae bacterium]